MTLPVRTGYHVYPPEETDAPIISTTEPLASTTPVLAPPGVLRTRVLTLVISTLPVTVTEPLELPPEPLLPPELLPLPLALT